MNTATMTALRVSMTGQIVLPEDEAYERLRNTFVHTGTPAIVVRCHDIEDVQCAVRHARDNALCCRSAAAGTAVWASARTTAAW